ncbi:hypothetical protein DQ04_00541150 [Trypanosoma grayi]|uniref:hypothetical protein n=1 Tax=Trypanosoma grayi TaxID=71804 RepID=UPI0004F4A1CD|nr:hypothetical protein DQ04_00541150 [Trypanosoma grayi]KEG14283.1 hypothetical protein DQ04_00541150 [Trypanosoma grayi]
MHARTLRSCSSGIRKVRGPCSVSPALRSLPIGSVDTSSATALCVTSVSTLHCRLPTTRETASASADTSRRIGGTTSRRTATCRECQGMSEGGQKRLKKSFTGAKEKYVL